MSSISKVGEERIRKEEFRQKLEYIITVIEKRVKDFSLNNNKVIGRCASRVREEEEHCLQRRRAFAKKKIKARRMIVFAYLKKKNEINLN